jgi:hypothetical protein
VPVVGVLPDVALGTAGGVSLPDVGLVAAGGFCLPDLGTAADTAAESARSLYRPPPLSMNPREPTHQGSGTLTAALFSSRSLRPNGLL